jgi:hypothetical protein
MKYSHGIHKISNPLNGPLHLTLTGTPTIFHKVTAFWLSEQLPQKISQHFIRE